MLLRDITKVYVSRANEVNNYGEYSKIWEFISTAYFNLQQDVNELDRKSSGEVDYSILKARTQQIYDIRKGDGISLINISETENFVPEYRVIDINKIGSTFVYRLEQYNGQN